MIAIDTESLTRIGVGWLRSGGFRANIIGIENLDLLILMLARNTATSAKRV